MIYLDTSALIKLYLLEEGSEFVQQRLESQSDPLPIWGLQEMELVDSLNRKVFWGEMTAMEADRLIGQFRDRRRRGLYYTPEVDWAGLWDSFHVLSEQSRSIGCSLLDIQHVACALQLKADAFISYLPRQRTLAVQAGLRVLPYAVRAAAQ